MHPNGQAIKNQDDAFLLSLGLCYNQVFEDLLLCVQCVDSFNYLNVFI